MILHIAERGDWESAQRGGEYRPARFADDGFIHCSTPEQVLSVANAFYSGRGGLVMLVIDERRLQAGLRWEPPAEAPTSAVLFPHIYGPLNLDAVVRVLAFEPNAEGEFSLPALP